MKFVNRLSTPTARRWRSSRLTKPTILTVSGLVLLCVVLFCWRLDGYGLFNITEAKQAEIARQMWVRHNWITPFYNGEIYFDKPVLLHWLIALGFPLFGINEWAVRLPSALSATGLIVSTWFFVASVANRRIALLTATILVANPFTFTLARIGHHDMLLTCFMTSALYCWYWGYSTGRQWGYLAFFGLLALAVLSKGPLALILSSLTIGLFLIWVGEWRKHLTQIPWLKGGLIFAAIALPWHLLMLLTQGWDFINNYFLFNNVSRFLSPNLNQEGPWFYYLPLILVGFFPWVVLLPTGLMRLPRSQWLRLSYWRQQPPRRQLTVFMVIWFVTALLFVSVSATKLPWYIYIGLPALAYLCAQAWEAQWHTPDRWLQPGLRLIGMIYGLCGIGFIVIPRFFADQPIVQTIVNMGIPIVWAIAYLLAMVGIWLSPARTQLLRVWGITLATFCLLALTLIYPLMPLIEQQVGGKDLFAIAKVMQQETCNTCPSDFSAALGVDEPSLNFYSRLNQITRFKYRYEVQEQLDRPQRLLLVTTDAALDRVRLNLSRYKPAFTAGIYKLFIVPPHQDLALHSKETRQTNLSSIVRSG